MTDRMASLLEMLDLHRQITALTVEAVHKKGAADIAPASQTYERLLPLFRDHLQRTLAFNERFVPPLDVDSVVHPFVDALFMSADLEQQLGRTQVAESRRDEAVALSVKYFGDEGDAEASRSRAAALILQARFNEALVALTKARAFYERSADLVKLLRVTIDMVDIYQWLGDFRRAEDELAHAGTLFKIKNPGAAPTSTGILAALLQFAKGPMEKADSRAVSEMGELYRASIELTYYQALIAKALRKWDAADAGFRTVRDEYERLGAAASIDYQFAAIAVERGEFSKALELVRQLKPQFTGFLRSKLSALLRIEARALIGLGRAEDGIALLRAAINDLVERYYDPDLLWRLRESLGDALDAAGDVEEAMRAYREATATVGILRRAPLGYRLDSTYLNDKLPMLERAISLACRTERPEDGAHLLEFLKSRTLTATLSLPARVEPNPYAEEFDTVTRELDAVDYQLYREPSAALRKRRDALWSQRAAILERIRFSDPRWRHLTEPIPFDLAKVQTLSRDRRQSILSLYLTSEAIISVLITPDSTRIGQVRLTPDVQSSISSYCRNLQQLQPDDDDYDIGLPFAALVPPALADEALNHRSLIVIPHRQLHLLPWACLKHRGRRLFERCPVGVLPNMSTYAALAGDIGPATSVALAVTPDYTDVPRIEPLPVGLETRDALLSLYKPPASLIGKPLLGREVNEAGVRKLLEDGIGQGSVAHIFCHGVFVTGEPMSSGLLLSDSKLDAAEVAGMRLQFDEAVLAACSTGWRPTSVGDIELSGDEILGLPGAFLEAGARAVLVSITKAELDTTDRFTRLYHAARVAGASPLVAMQQTQSTMIKEVPAHSIAGLCSYACS